MSLTRWLSRSHKNNPSKHNARRPRAHRLPLQLETLEDRLAPAVKLVSFAVSDPHPTAHGTSLTTLPPRSISDSGQYVVYLSDATNLVNGQTDTNGKNDVFLYDKSTDTNTLISRHAGATTTAANGESFVPYISGNGQWIAFFSDAPD